VQTNFGGVDSGLGSNTNGQLNLNNNNNNPFLNQNSLSEQLVLQETRQQVITNNINKMSMNSNYISQQRQNAIIFYSSLVGRVSE
jgi:hypothetical protein